MAKVVTATEMYRAYKEAQKKFNKSNSNSDCIAMLSAYGVYKAAGGTRAFSLGKHRFSTDKARAIAVKKYAWYIEYIHDFATFYIKIVEGNFKYKWELKRMIGSKYRRLIDPKLSSDDAALIIKAMIESELTPQYEAQTIECLLVAAKRYIDHEYDVVKQL